MEKYVQPFITTCQNVFQSFLELNAIPGNPYFIERTESEIWDISGLIGLTGEAQGAVAISMKKDFALYIASKLTDSDHDSLDDLVVDAVGEIINIIAGNVKKDLEEMFRLVISLPTIVRGENHETFWTTQNSRAICIPFNIEKKYNFILSVALRGDA